MSYLMALRQRLLHILQMIWKKPLALAGQLNWRNAKKLWKAIREEPIDLVLENLLTLLKSGQGQAIYNHKFIEASEHLKFYIVDCRKEFGMLKLVIWVLSKNNLKKVFICSDKQEIFQPDYTFEKPVLSALFSEFEQYQQKGYIFQIDKEAPLASFSLILTDSAAHDLKWPVGDMANCRPTNTISPSLERLDKKIKLVLLFHDWALPPDQEIDWAGLSENLSVLPGLPEKMIICTHAARPSFLPSIKGQLEVSFGNLRETLQKLETDYLLLLSLDAVLPADFFLFLRGYLKNHQNVDLLYFDEDIQHPKVDFHSPLLKPAFSPEYLECSNYIGGNYCIGFPLGKRLNWFTEWDQTSGAYHFLLRLLPESPSVQRLTELRLHLPNYPSPYFECRAKAEEQVRRDHFSRNGFSINPGWVPGSNEVLRPLSSSPLVSIIIPFKDHIELLQQCVQSILEKTEYDAFEIILVSNKSSEEATFQYLDRIVEEEQRVLWVAWDHPFNYAELNNWAAKQAKGAFLLLLNNDVQIITKGWLTKMLSYMEIERVGAVGAKLLYPDDTVQHAGVYTGIGGIAAHAHKHYPDTFGGYQDRANTVQNVSACTAACLLVRRSLFENLGGFDAEHLPIAFNDVDLCLKIRKAGFRIVYTPFVKLYHFESISRGAEDTTAKKRRARREIGFFRKKWWGVLEKGDPYYHPGFSKRRDFETLM